MEILTRQEEGIMLYIWKLGTCFIRDVLNEMPEPRPPYTTVASIVRNLERKKYVTPRKFGTITQFTPAIKESDYKRHFMSDVVDNYFTGSYKELISFFVHDRKLSKEDLMDLINQIENEE
jgi:predicted transcriptional regulator